MAVSIGGSRTWLMLTETHSETVGTLRSIA